MKEERTSSKVINRKIRGECPKGPLISRCKKCRRKNMRGI
jgi:predicted RNA-binding Zn-ribbon protein involved in translation (DUF1610 family)